MSGRKIRSCVGQWLVFAVIGAFMGSAFAAVGDGGSKCPDASCTPAPVGSQCEPRYERDDGCCPVWYCSNGQTAYGMSKSSASGSGSSFSYSSSSSSSGGGFPMNNPFGGGNNPFGGFGGGGGGNPFANLFGGLFGR